MPSIQIKIYSRSYHTEYQAESVHAILISTLVTVSMSKRLKKIILRCLSLIRPLNAFVIIFKDNSLNLSKIQVSVQFPSLPKCKSQNAFMQTGLYNITKAVHCQLVDDLPASKMTQLYDFAIGKSDLLVNSDVSFRIFSDWKYSSNYFISNQRGSQTLKSLLNAQF